MGRRRQAFGAGGFRRFEYKIRGAILRGTVPAPGRAVSSHASASGFPAAANLVGQGQSPAEPEAERTLHVLGRA